MSPAAPPLGHDAHDALHGAAAHVSPNAATDAAQEQAWQRALTWFEQLTPADLAQMSDLYTDDARFKDPFHEVVGVPAIRAIFERMFAQLLQPRFVITRAVRQGTHGFVTWDFVFAQPSRPAQSWTIRGATHLVLREDHGVWRIAVHRDYWDAAEELYEKLPLVGGLMRWLKRRAGS